MKTIVIGTGPAGLIAASTAAGKDNQVIILEKNEKAGKKLFITGKGRCNLTNSCNEREFIANVVSNPKFLFSAINKFSSKDTIDWFESKGCPLVIERGNRVFPESYKAYEQKVLEKLEKEELVKDVGTTKDIFGEFVDKVIERSLYLYKNRHCHSCARLLAQGKSTRLCPKCHHLLHG